MGAVMGIITEAGEAAHGLRDARVGMNPDLRKSHATARLSSALVGRASARQQVEPC